MCGTLNCTIQRDKSWQVMIGKAVAAMGSIKEGTGFLLLAVLVPVVFWVGMTMKRFWLAPNFCSGTVAAPLLLESLGWEEQNAMF